jgi:hypothetical protein
VCRVSFRNYKLLLKIRRKKKHVKGPDLAGELISEAFGIVSLSKFEESAFQVNEDVTNLINALPGQSSVNTVQHATVDETVFCVVRATHVFSMWSTPSTHTEQ